MRNFVCLATILATLSVLLPAPATAQVTAYERLEQQLQPLPTTDWSKEHWKVRGYVHGGNTDCRQDIDHYRLIIENPELLGFYVETDWPSGFNGSWLKELHINLPLSADGKIYLQAGRIFEPGASIYSPGPDGLRFANYQHGPRRMSFYGTGVKLNADFGSWNAQLSFTGSTSTAFDDPKQFEHGEVGFRVRKYLDKNTDVTFAGQAGDDFTRFGAEYRERTDDEFRYAAGVYYTDEYVGSQFTWFAQCEYKVADGVWPHLRVDKWPTNGETVVTVGVGIEIGKDVFLAFDRNKVEGWQGAVLWKFGEW